MIYKKEINLKCNLCDGKKFLEIELKHEREFIPPPEIKEIFFQDYCPLCEGRGKLKIYSNKEK